MLYAETAAPASALTERSKDTFNNFESALPRVETAELNNETKLDTPEPIPY